MTGVTLKWKQANIFQKTQKLFNSLGEVAGDNFLKQDLARFTRDMVYKRVKSGKGVSSDKVAIGRAQPIRFKPLSKNYKYFRQSGIARFQAKRYHYNSKTGRKLGYEMVEVKIKVGQPALGEYGSPNKSNLTLSGQMLNSMSFDIKKFGFVVMIPETARRGAKFTNAQLARWVSKAGRPFMNLTAGEERIVKSRMRKTIQRQLRKLLK